MFLGIFVLLCGVFNLIYSFSGDPRVSGLYVFLGLSGICIGCLLIGIAYKINYKKVFEKRRQERADKIRRAQLAEEHKAIWKNQIEKIKQYQKGIQENKIFQETKERVSKGYDIATLLKSCGAPKADNLLEKLMQLSIQMSGNNQNGDIGLLSPHNIVFPFPKGSSFYIGKYYQNDETEPSVIEWIVVDSSEDELLLISKYALEYKKMNEDYKQNANWSTCSLRSWLNNQFYNTAFSSEEKALIKNRKNVTTPVKQNHSYSYYSTRESKNEDTPIETYDKVFLLSNEEFFKLGRNAQSLSETNHCKNGNPYKSVYNKATKMWLRNHTTLSGIYIDDQLKISSQSMTNNTTVIRPAIVISMLGFQ